MREREPRRSPARRVAGAAILAAVPWVWFLVRDRAPLLDLVAVGLPPAGALAAAAVVVVAAVRRTWPPALVAVSVAAFTAVVVAAPRLAQPAAAPSRPLLLSSANVFEGNEEPGAAVDALLRRDADVLTLLEAEPDVTEPIDAAYRHNIDENHVSIHSRYPMRELPSGASIRRQIVVRARVWGPAGPFILYAVHQMNPLYDAAFAEQTRDLEALVARASSEKQPVVLAGDFNVADRSRGYRTLTTSFRDAMRAGAAAGSTYANGAWSALFLRIDYVFVTPRWCAGSAATFAVPGSDHRGIGAAVGPCPASGA